MISQNNKQEIKMATNNEDIKVIPAQEGMYLVRFPTKRQYLKAKEKGNDIYLKTIPIVGFAISAHNDGSFVKCPITIDGSLVGNTWIIQFTDKSSKLNPWYSSTGDQGFDIPDLRQFVYSEAKFMYEE
jgi:hypothetical protein